VSLLNLAITTQCEFIDCYYIAVILGGQVNLSRCHLSNFHAACKSAVMNDM
jgi:hypothetical protein